MFTFSEIMKQRKTLAMGALVMLTVIGYNVLRGMKKVIMLTLPTAGAAYIPFVKTMLVMPLSIIIGAFYLFVRHRRGIVTAYYIVTLSFLAYFVLFTFVLLPNLSFFTADPNWIASTQQNYPHFKFLVGLLANWPIAIYYVAAELWGTYALVVLFWQIANELYTPQEATTTFPFFIFISSISIIIASFALQLLSLTSNPLVSCTTTMGLLSVGMVSIVFGLNRTHRFNQTGAEQALKKKHKISLLDSVRLTFASPHVFYIGVCVFSFGMLVNFFELSLDHKLAEYYVDTKQLLEFQSWFTRTKGLLCILANFANALLMRRLGWFGVAMITPCVCILSANLFLFSTYHIHFLQHTLQLTSAEELILLTGCVLLVITYACKYSFFDTTKELAFTPLPNSVKASAKAVADGICGRAGKSGSSFVQATLITISAAQSVPDIIPYLMYFGAALSVFWIWSMTKLNQSYVEKMRAIATETPSESPNTAADQAASPVSASADRLEPTPSA